MLQNSNSYSNNLNPSLENVYKMGKTKSVIIKTCLNCEKEYETKLIFKDIRKTCSLKCRRAYSKKTPKYATAICSFCGEPYKRRLTLNRKVQKKGRRLCSGRCAQAYRMERKRKQLLKENIKKEFIKNEDGTIKFGEDLLTLKNYKEPLIPIPKEEGVGWYGTLAAHADGERVQCHVCGEFRDALPVHIRNAHKMNARDYREKYGLSYTTALVSEKFRMKLKERTLEWLESLSEDEKEAYKQKRILQGRDGQRKRRRTQPKQTLEAMNKAGSCPDQTLQEIKDVKYQLGHVPSQKEFIAFKKSQRFVHLAYKHFGSWEKAIEMCGFDKEEDWRKDRKGKMYKRYTDDELLEYLRIYAEEHQQVPTVTDWKRDLLPDYQTYIEHFGTIEAARQLAGVYEIVEKSKTLLTRSKYYRKKTEKIVTNIN